MRTVWPVAAWLPAVVLAGAAEAQFFSEKFEAYQAGSTIAGQGGWETWDNDPAANTTVSDALAFSAPNSLLVAGAADIVHQFTQVTAGTWYAKARVFVPSTQTGEVWFILLDTYAAGPGADNWSVQVVMCVTGCTTAGAVPGSVANLGGSEVPGVGTAPLVTDQWVELRVEVNLAANQYSVFYDGALLDTQQWTVSGGLRIQAVNLFSNGSSQSYMDDIWLDTTVPVGLMGFTVN